MNVKLHLDYAEYDPLKRTAEAFGCQCGPECKRIHTDFAAMRGEVLNTKLARKNNLPKWADSAGSAHNYEGLSPDEPAKSNRAKF
ncbi:MAG: hypothetical protein HYV75_05905 [Opitutae bacterium]|nr:hypothetical protein [Opitutae bacterium]